MFANPTVTALLAVSPLALLAVLYYLVDLFRRRADVNRITEQIVHQGWTMLKIRRKPFFWGGSDQNRGRRYEVTYRGPNDATVTATCFTNLFIGVVWVSAAPPVPGASPGY